MEDINKISKFISLILRHKPEVIGIDIELKGGWCDTKELIEKTNKKRPHYNLDMELLEKIVSEDSKQRYSFNKDKTKIRANQGHSIKGIDLGLSPLTPPKKLYHGTAPKNRLSIYEKGILKMSRQYVHLSEDFDTAFNVGLRTCRFPIIFLVDAEKMNENGYKFYKSENGVWLIDFVPSEYIIEVERENIYNLSREIQSKEDF